MDTREQAIHAAYQVIVECGVQGATYRKIAAQAQLSPGTLTYHFPTIDALLLAAFEQFSDRFSTSFRQRMLAATSQAQVCDAVVDFICGDIWPTPEHLLVTFELYAMASRSGPYRTMLHRWQQQSREALELRFQTATARLLDATVEGLTIQRVLGQHPMGRAEITAHIARIAADGFLEALPAR